MDLTFLTDYFVPVITGICLCVGFVVKKWIRDVDNKYIPSICAALGLIIAIIMNWGHLSADIILAGLLSGLASTGLHQAFKQLICIQENQEEQEAEE